MPSDLEQELLRYLRAAIGFSAAELRDDLRVLPPMRGEPPIVASVSDVTAALLSLEAAGLVVRDEAGEWRKVPERDAVGPQKELFA